MQKVSNLKDRNVMLKKLAKNGGIMGLAVIASVLAPNVVNAEELRVTDEASLNTCIKAEANNVCVVDANFDTKSWIMPVGTKTVDLNGHTINMYTGNFWISNGQTFTITDSKGTGKVETKSKSYSTISVNKNGSVTLDGGEFVNNTEAGMVVSLTGNNTGDSVYFKLGENAKLTGGYGVAIHGDANSGRAANNVKAHIYGKIDATLMGITTNGLINSNNTTVAVPEVNIYEGSQIKSAMPAIYAAGTASWKIAGGSLTGTEALSIKSGSFKISGGTFTATGEKDDNPAPYNNGSEPTGAAISVTANSAYDRNVTIAITGGEFISEKGYALYEGKTSAENTAIVEISITDGDFVAKDGNNSAIKITSESDSLKNFISGGTYSSDVDSVYLASNTEVVDGEVVYKKADYTAVYEQIEAANEIDKTKYTEESVAALEEAIAAVVKDKNITEQDEVDAMAKAIEEAIENLVENHAEPESPAKSEDPSDEKDPEDDKTVSENPQTLDGITGYVALAGVSVGALGLVLKKKVD